MDTIVAGTATINGTNGADWWLNNNSSLPNYYVTKRVAAELGWISLKGNLHIVASGKQIGGDVYKNKECRLPVAPGRIWYEADINYKQGFRNKVLETSIGSCILMMGLFL